MRSVPLPGWSIFDALFISWHAHPEPATSGGAFADTPIARIQRFRRRFIIVVGILLVLSTIHRVWSHTTAPNSSKTTASSQPSSPNRLSSLYGWRSPLKTPLSSSALYDAAPLAGYPLSSAYYAALYNASSPPARIRPSEGRMTMLQAIARSRSSAYNPAEFIINHAEIMSHVERGADPIDLIARKPSNSDQAPVLRPHVVSAVIVHSPDYDISSTQLIISMSAKYPFVREIIIWNNDFSLNINENVSTLITQGIRISLTQDDRRCIFPLSTTSASYLLHFVSSIHLLLSLRSLRQFIVVSLLPTQNIWPADWPRKKFVSSSHLHSYPFTWIPYTQAFSRLRLSSPR